MKEESELLQDLRKLQVKKQLLIKRSKQLKDEQLVKLNIDLHKEKDLRTDLEKKFSNLEKKLNQIEKEIENRNREKSTSNLVDKSRLNSFKVFDSECKTKSKDDKKDSRHFVVSKKSIEQQTENARNANPIDLGKLSNQVKNQSTSLLAGKRSTSGLTLKSAPKNETRLPRVQTKLSKQTVEQQSSSAFVIGPLFPLQLSKTTANKETNTEPIDTEAVGCAPQSVNLAKDQRLVQNNLNNVIRDILDRQIQQNSERTNAINRDLHPTINQPNSRLNDQNIFDRLEENLTSSTTTVSNASTTVNQPNSGESSRDSSSSPQLSPISPTNVVHSPSSSDNFSF